MVLYKGNRIKKAAEVISSLKIKNETSNKNEIVSTELLFAEALIELEEYEKATKHFIKAANITENSGDYESLAKVFDYLAKIYICQSELDLAKESINKSLSLAKQVKSNLIYAFSICTEAIIKINDNQAQEALNLLEEAIPLFKENSSLQGMANVKKTQAFAYKKLGKLNISIERFHEAADLFRKIDKKIELVKTYQELSTVYKESQDLKMALSTLLEALRIAKQNNLHTLIKKIEVLIFEFEADKTSEFDYKTSSEKEDIFPKKKPFLDALTLIEGFSQAEPLSKEPLLSLLRIGRSIAAETDVDKLLEIITEETQKALCADRCTVFLLDRDTNELWSKIASGLGKKEEIRFPADKGIAGHVAATGESINIKDTYSDPRFNKEIDKKTGYKTKTILCMPMRNLSHEIIGVFQVLNKIGEGNSFTDDDEDLLIAIGSSAGIALENARLFKKQQLMYEGQKKTFSSFINTLAAVIDARDKITSGHSKRVKEYALTIAEEIGLSEEEMEILEYAALLHDFGKIGIKDDILCKKGKLTNTEYKHIQEHVKITDQILSNMFFEEKFKSVREIASSHHEKYNGSGYFRGLKGEEIPLGGRILAVSDVFDAITSKRHYRARMPFLEAVCLMKEGKNSHFDPKIVEAFLDICFYKIFNILFSETDEPHLDPKAINLLKRFTLGEFYLILKKEKEERDPVEEILADIFKKYYKV